MVQEMIRIFECAAAHFAGHAVRLGRSLEAFGKGEKLNTALVNKLAARISRNPAAARVLEFDTKRTRMGFGYWTERHIEKRAQAQSAGGDREGRRRTRRS